MTSDHYGNHGFSQEAADRLYERTALASLNPAYDSVLAELHQELARLDNAIAVVKACRHASIPADMPTPPPGDRA